MKHPDELTFVQAINGDWLDVRGIDYLPIKDVEADYRFGKSTSLLIKVPCPKNVPVIERKTPLTYPSVYDSYFYDNPTTPSASALAGQLVTRVRQLELENAQLLAQSAAAKRSDAGDRAKRHLERYRKKFTTAQEAGDHAAAA